MHMRSPLSQAGSGSRSLGVIMQRPKVGDVILRGSPGAGFVLLDAATEDHIAGPAQFSRALQFALALGALTIWRELLDQAGQAIGPPVQITKGHAISR